MDIYRYIIYTYYIYTYIYIYINTYRQTVLRSPNKPTERF